MPVKEAAKYIGVDVNDVRTLIELKYLRDLKLGATKIAIRELDRFIQEATENGIDYNMILEPYRKMRRQQLA